MSVKVLSLLPGPGASPEEGVWVACNLNAQATSAVSFHDNCDKRNIVINSLTIIATRKSIVVTWLQLRRRTSARH